jgi:hypothetical protein
MIVCFKTEFAIIPISGGISAPFNPGGTGFYGFTINPGFPTGFEIDGRTRNGIALGERPAGSGGVRQEKDEEVTASQVA